VADFPRARRAPSLEAEQPAVTGQGGAADLDDPRAAAAGGKSVAALPMRAQSESSATDATLRRSEFDVVSMTFPPGGACPVASRD